MNRQLVLIEIPPAPVPPEPPAVTQPARIAPRRTAQAEINLRGVAAARKSLRAASQRAAVREADRRASKRAALFERLGVDGAPGSNGDLRLPEASCW